MGGKLKVGYTVHLNRNRVVVSSMKYMQKQPQCTYQAKMVIGSSLTPHTALFMLPTPCSEPSCIYKVRKMLPVKVDLAIFSPVIGVSWIVLECGFQ